MFVRRCEFTKISPPSLIAPQTRDVALPTKLWWSGVRLDWIRLISSAAASNHWQFSGKYKPLLLRFIPSTLICADSRSISAHKIRTLHLSVSTDKVFSSSCVSKCRVRLHSFVIVMYDTPNGRILSRMHLMELSGLLSLLSPPLPKTREAIFHNISPIL